MSPLADLLHRFRKDERGVFLVVFAVLGLVLIATSGAVVDFTRIQQARTKAQIALDAAALALSAQVGKTGVTSDTLKAQAQLLLTERVADPTVTATVDTAVPDKDNGKLTLTASVTIPTYFVQLIGVRTVKASMLSEVTRSSHNLEVAVAADITYSMTGSVTCADPTKTGCTRLSALKDALKTSIGLLVKTEQTPTYSKMAIAPYSNGVNVGTYANSVQGGALPDGKTISSITGMTGSVQTITGITKANPGVVTTASANSFAAGDYVYISGVRGMTQIADGIYRVGTVTNGNKSFQLRTAGNVNINTSTYSTYTANSARTMECAASTCAITITSNNHGYANGAFIYAEGGAPVQTDKSWEVSARTTNTFVPLNANPLTFVVGQKFYCTTYGCQYYRYSNANSGYTTFKYTPCAVERTTTTYASLDTSPAIAPVGIQYATIANSDYPGSITLEACPTSEIVPLTSKIADLESSVNAFVAQGSTAGHIGLAWAWYMLSPTFTGGIPTWPTSPISSKPSAYLDDDTVKAIILMTDGEFNTMYHFGVPSKNSDLANATTRSNTDAPLGTSFQQAYALCAEIKKSAYDIRIYTIGFGIATGGAGDTFLKTCATKESYYKTASDAATLEAAFREISDELSNLRVSK